MADGLNAGGGARSFSFCEIWRVSILERHRNVDLVDAWAKNGARPGADLNEPVNSTAIMAPDSRRGRCSMLVLSNSRLRELRRHMKRE